MPQLEVTEHERTNYPTYRTAQRVVNGDLTAPAEFVGWTALRALIIMPGMAIAGVRGKQLIFGSLTASTMVSMFALYRSYATKRMENHKALEGCKQAQRRGRPLKSCPARYRRQLRGRR